MGGKEVETQELPELPELPDPPGAVADKTVAEVFA